MKIKLSHPTGNANVRAVAQGFADANMLEHFYTSLAVFDGSISDKLSKFGPLAELQRRSFDTSLKDLTVTNPWTEISRLISTKADWRILTNHEKGIFSIDAVYRNLDKWVSKKINQNLGKNVGVYAYEDGAKSSFQAAKSLGLPCFYDLPIGYWRAARRLLESEIEKWPDWASTLTGFNDSNLKLENKDIEIALSDHIFVASSFTAKTLEDYPGKLPNISVIPYGYPTVTDEPIISHSAGGKLRLLFVGGLSQRKGVANLFTAIKGFENFISLTIVGRKASDTCYVLDQELKRHNWIPTLAHQEVLRLMRSHDILIFPSLFEGFGLVITEAMSQGTPVITTERTAGPDLIEHGHNGWLIEAGSVESIKTILDQLLTNPYLVKENGRAAIESAKKRPWAKYGREIADAVKAFDKLA